MLRVWLLSLLVACGTTTVQHVWQPTKIVVVKVPCLTLAPPATPALLCGPLVAEDCEDVKTAAWADYGKAAHKYLRLYVWPVCEDK